MVNSIQAINREHERVHEGVVGAYQLGEVKLFWLAADRGGASLSLVLMIMCERPTLIGLFIFIASLLHCGRDDESRFVVTAQFAWVATDGPVARRSAAGSSRAPRTSKFGYAIAVAGSPVE